jgi:hypothetical protein
MGERTLFPNASTKETLAYCWRQMQPDRAAFTGACTAIVLGTLANAVAAPLIFASLLSRISQLGPHAHEGLWQSFGPCWWPTRSCWWPPRSSGASAAG